MRDVPRHRDEKMQMVRHQNEASNEESALQSSEAKFLERFKDKLVGQDGPSSLNATVTKYSGRSENTLSNRFRRGLCCSDDVLIVEPSDVPIVGARDSFIVDAFLSFHY
jgi:hypothetical protein